MGLRGTLRIIEEPWGFSIWKQGKQLGAAPGMSITEVMTHLGAMSWIVVGKGKAEYIYCALR